MLTDWSEGPRDFLQFRISSVTKCEKNCFQKKILRFFDKFIIKSLNTLELLYKKYVRSNDRKGRIVKGITGQKDQEIGGWIAIKYMMNLKEIRPVTAQVFDIFGLKFSSILFITIQFILFGLLSFGLDSACQDLKHCLRGISIGYDSYSTNTISMVFSKLPVFYP